MIDISDVNVGDRVKLTRENGDEATFTVTVTYRGGELISSDTNLFDTDDWDTLEIVERASKPVPGLYSNRARGSRAVLLPDGRAYYTANSGAWIPSETHQGYAETYKALRELGDWKREVTF